MNIRPPLQGAWLCVWLLATQYVSAQLITKEQLFPVAGYSVFNFQSPFKVVPGRDGRFHFLEYWVKNAAKIDPNFKDRDSSAGPLHNRPSTNFFLQVYSNNYIELSFEPVTREEEEKMTVKDLYQTAEGSVVIGDQKRPDGLLHTVASFFGSLGKPLGDSVVQLSNYDRKRRRSYQEWIKVSPNKNYILWVCRNGKDYFASVWTAIGEEVWQNELSLPQKDYQIGDAAIDDDGTPYFLLTPEKPVVGQSLILASYQDTTQSFPLQQAIGFEKEGMLVRSELRFGLEGAVLITGILSSADSMFLRNGEKLDEEVNWTHVFVTRYDRSLRYDSVAILTYRYQQVKPIPESWVEKYRDKGTNFSDHRLVISADAVVMLMEEQYNNKDVYYGYDLAILTFDLEDGSLRWSHLLEKQQRDIGANSFISYVEGVSQIKNRLHLVYLSARGASGELTCASFDMKSGKRTNKRLASNQSARYLIFPRRSAMVGPTEMLLVGLGNPTQNDYKLMTVRF